MILAMGTAVNSFAAEPVVKKVAEEAPRFDNGLILLKEINNKKSLNDKIFNQEVKVDLHEKYQEYFGHTRSEELLFSKNRVDNYIEYSPGVWVGTEEDERRKKKYSQFVLRKVTEFHLDSWARSNSYAKHAYKAKERLKNINVEFRPKYSVNMRYSLTGNFLDVSLKNPYKIDTKLRMVFSGGLGNFSSPDFLLKMRKSFRSNWSLLTDYQFNKGRMSFTLKRKFRKNLSAFLSGSTGFSENSWIYSLQDYKPNESVKVDKRILVGFKWST